MSWNLRKQKDTTPRVIYHKIGRFTVPARTRREARQIVNDMESKVLEQAKGEK